MPTYPDIATPVDNLYTVFCLRTKPHSKGKNQYCVIKIHGGVQLEGHSEFFRLIFTKTQVDSLLLSNKTNKLSLDYTALSADIQGLTDPNNVVDCSALTNINNKYFKKKVRS